MTMRILPTVVVDIIIYIYMLENKHGTKAATCKWNCRRGEKIIHVTNQPLLCNFAVYILRVLVVFGSVLKESSFTGKPYSIHNTHFGSQPYFSANPNNSNPHLLGPKQKGAEYHPRTKPELTSLFLYTKS